MQFSRPLFLSFLAVSFALLQSLAWGQNLTEKLQQLQAAELEKYRAILNQPIDPGALTQEKVRLHRMKDQAAVMINDMAAKEANLREWIKIDPVGGRWMLRAHWWYTGQIEQSIELGEQLVAETTNPYMAVLARANLAKDFIDSSQLEKAEPLVLQMEKLIKSDMANFRNSGVGQYWLNAAEMLYFKTRAALLVRKGKWAEAEQLGRLSLERARLHHERMTTFIRSPEEQEVQKRMVIYAFADQVALLSAMGKWIDAQWALRDAFEYSRKAGYNETHMYLVYMLTSRILNGLGSFEEALGYAQKAEILQTGIADNRGQSSRWMHARIQHLSALMGMGKWTQANEVLNETRTLTAQTSLNAERVLDPSLVAWVWLQSGAAAQATPFLQQRLAETEKRMGKQHMAPALQAGMLGAALAAQGKRDEALPYFEWAHQVFTAPESLTADDGEDALQRRMKRFVLERYLRLGVAQAHQDPAQAEKMFRIADSLNASSVQSALNDAASRATIRQPKLAELVRKEQDARQEAAGLLAYLSGQNTASETKATPMVVAQMQTRLRQLERERKTIKETLQREFPEYFQLLQPKAPGLPEIAAQLKPDEVFLQVVNLEESSFVWAVDSSGQVRFHASDMNAHQLQALVHAVRKTLDVAGMGRDAPRFDQARASAIYQALLGPIEASLAGKKHLIVATSGPLAQMPLAVLPTRASGSPGWLIEQHAISHVPAASGWLAIQKMARRPTAPEPLLAWGDPVFDLASANRAGGAGAQATRAVVNAEPRKTRGALESLVDAPTYSQIPPLPETRDEVLSLAKIMRANPEQDLFLGLRATRQSVLEANQRNVLAQKRVLVFATHGLLAGDLPNLNQPALAMAATASDKESPLLTLEDVLGLNINADWVVLSACNTAGADGRAEEALSGLARGFFYAGGRSLLVTHWSVESESAMLLTTKTFDAYNRDAQLRRAEAVRLAMLEVMKMPQFQHPAFWAPYALVGEGGR